MLGGEKSVPARRCLEVLGADGQLTLEIPLEAEVAWQARDYSIRLDSLPDSLDGRIGEKLNFRIKDPNSTDEWQIEATLEERNDTPVLVLRSIQPLNVTSAADRGSDSDVRVTVPDDSKILLEHLRHDRTITDIDIVDLSLGGIGLRADRQLSLRRGDRVEIQLNIRNEFGGTLEGEIAFTRNDPNGMSIGIEFDPLDKPTHRALRGAIDNLLAEVTP